MDTKNILFICGGAFAGIEKLIEDRQDRKGIGFGAAIQTKAEKRTDTILRGLQPHDLIKFGLIPELLGRLPVITTLDPLDREQMVNILTEPKNALVKQYVKLMAYDRVELVFDQAALEAAADQAIERGMGARGLRAILENCMTRIMYEIPSDPTVCRVTITADCVNHGAEPLVERDESRLDRPLPRLGAAALRDARGGYAQGDAS